MDAVTVLRQAMLFAHLLVFALAITLVLRTDLAILQQRADALHRLPRDGTRLAAALALLWLTGLALIGLDPGWHGPGLLERPKLLAKLGVVGLLSLNGLALHLWAFPALMSPPAQPARAASLCALLGAVSSVSWLFAAFVGCARLIAPAMSLAHFATLYLLCLLPAGLLALLWVRPFLVGLMFRPGQAVADEDPRTAAMPLTS